MAKSASGQIRIIGGQWRGRKLPVLSAEGLRPTTDRVKETVFNWLQFELPTSRVLDLFAGTGSLGLEALSRGAAHATFIDINKQAVQQLHNNLRTLQAHDRGHILQQDAVAALDSLDAGSIDVVFVDPPFAKDWLPKVIPALATHPCLNSRAWIYVESGVQDRYDDWPGHWILHREKRAGQVYSRLFQLTAASD